MGSLGLITDPATSSCIFCWEKRPLSGCCPVFIFISPHQIQPSTSLLKEEIVMKLNGKYKCLDLFLSAVKEVAEARKKSNG